MCHFLPILASVGPKATACAGAKSWTRKLTLLHFDVVSVVSRQTLIMLRILASSQTGMQAMQMLDKKPPTWMSILSSCTIFAVFCRATAGELSSSEMTSSIGRPLMPPEALMRSAAICRPTTAVLPPAAPAPDSGCSEPILNGLAAPNAARHGAGTSIMAPIAPPPQPTRVRRVTLPRYQMSSAHFSSCHFSAIESPPTGVAVLEEKLIPRQSRAPASETRSSPIPRALDPWRALGGEFVPLANAILGLVST